MKDIKIIFFDIDGTLIAMDQDTISEKTLEALKRLQEKGVKLCLATGRGPMLVPHFEGVEFDAFLTYNGSYCYDHSGTLYSNCIPLKDIERIIKNADKMGKPVALATKDRMAANGKDQDLIDYYAFGNAEVDVAEDFEDIKKEKVYQVLMLSLIHILVFVHHSQLLNWQKTYQIVINSLWTLLIHWKNIIVICRIWNLQFRKENCTSYRQEMVREQPQLHSVSPVN